jgi:hypothetical protein
MAAVTSESRPHDECKHRRLDAEHVDEDALSRTGDRDVNKDLVSITATATRTIAAIGPAMRRG